MSEADERVWLDMQSQQPQMTSPRTYDEIQSEIGDITRSCDKFIEYGDVSRCPDCSGKIEKLAKERDSL